MGLTKNKRGWIKIVEAFLAILLVTGVLLIVVNDTLKIKDSSSYSSTVLDLETSILREIQLDNSLRSEILSTTGEVSWDSFPSSTRATIEARTPSYEDCVGEICEPNTKCSISENVTKDVYAESILITTANNDVFSPRVLKIFCWEK